MKKVLMGLMMLVSVVGILSYVSAQEGYTATSMAVSDGAIMCIMQYDPVCGENGVTYGNSCMAQGVAIAYNGECEQLVVDDAPTACTLEYAPVCANVQVQCIAAPCFPVPETFSNRCMAEAAGAEVIFEGDCNIAQSGVPIEPTPSDMVTWAYSLGITKYDNTAMFMYDAAITREQAAKMIMVAIEISGVQPWMIKQQAGSCEWSDTDQIDVSLVNHVDASCAKGLFQGFKSNFMPKAYLTDTDARTIIYRVAEYVPALADMLMTVRLAAPQDKVLTRGEFLQGLYNLYQQIAPTVLIDPPALPVIPMIDGDYYLSVYNSTQISGTGITMSLSGGVVSARICNMINGSYTIEHDAAINYMSFDELMSTKMACADDQITMIENQFTTIASAELNTLIEDQLTINLSGGNMMLWIKQ